MRATVLSEIIVAAAVNREESTGCRNSNLVKDPVA